MATAAAKAGAGAGAGVGKDDDLADLVRRLVDVLARYADRLPFDLDRQVRARICDFAQRVDAFYFPVRCVASLLWDSLVCPRWRFVWEKIQDFICCPGAHWLDT
jgi:hypothetical protein